MEPLLTEIILEGFKSFRDKTSLKFDGPFTAIVGPNGSGKSNVVDAIKWVLGDPSPRSIRASTGLEAIYRPANGDDNEDAGFASIIIKIDNSEPESQDEPAVWEIERRYYRSGESIYTLNGKTARLRDVRAVMARKGFGLGSLSVVGQGEIDGFLSLVPSDRRLVFEDLARISDFKANKRKILGRLDDCARNDERLRDLLGEILVRVDNLAVQAEAASRHAELTSSADEIKAQLAAQEYLLAGRNVERHEKRLEELNSELDDSRGKRDDTADRLATAREDLKKARDENFTTLAECEDGRRELDRARAEERRLTEANKHLSTLIVTLENELAERTERIEKLTARLDELAKTASNAELERSHAKRRYLDLDVYLSRRWGYTRACERERERLAGRVERLQGEGSFFARDAEFHSRRAEALRIESEEIGKKSGDLRGEIVDLESEAVRLKYEYELLQARKREIEVLLSEIKQKLAALRSQLDDATESKRAVETEISTLENEIKLLGELEESKEGYGEGVRAILDRRGELHGLIGTLGELVSVEPGHEAVVERALGDSIEFLLIDTFENALALIETVKAENLGKVTCIVVELLPDLPQITETGDILDHCSIDPDLKPVLSLFLLSAIAADSLTGIDPSELTGVIVTSDGAVFRPPAFLSGGSEVKSASGIFTRRARLDELEELVVNRKWKSAELVARIHLLENRISRLTDDLTRESSALDEVNDSLAINITSRQKNNERTEQVAREMKSLEERLDRVVSESEGCLENARLATQGTEAVKRARTDAEQALELLEKDLPRFAAQVEDLRARVQRAIVEEASYREEAERARAEIARIEEEIASSRDEISERKGRIDAVRNEARGISEELDNAIDLRDSLEGTLPELERKEKEASERINSLQTNLDEMETALDEARERVSEMEGALHAQEIKLAEIRGGLISLEKGLDEFPEFAERIRSGELMGKDIPSKKELNEKFETINLDLEELGDVNPLAIEEEKMARQRQEELKSEREDLILAEEELRKALEEIERESEKAFVSTFNDAKARFSEVFAALFPGGSGELSLTDPDDPLESGIDVRIKFPGKGELDLLQFSGGERSLIALALLFAILKVKPSSFTLLDEVEAALDDVNTQKFLDYLAQEFDDRQFIMITHNKITMERADRLYGVTMTDGGISQVVSVDLKKLKEEGIEEALGAVN